jgi:hypothetical protein
VTTKAQAEDRRCLTLSLAPLVACPSETSETGQPPYFVKLI